MISCGGLTARTLRITARLGFSSEIYPRTQDDVVTGNS